MANLFETQRAFAAALRDGAHATRAATLFVGDDGLAARRLAVYRGNVVAAAAKALGAAFPVARQVVGEEFFDAMARRYWRQCPSTSGDLYDYGGQFASFLDEFEPARQLPYLGDLARLEWLVHQAYCAACASRLDPTTLSSVAEDRMGTIVLTLLPGTSLLRSVHPVVRIWTIHQADYAGTFDVDWGAGQRALVARDGMRVAVSEPSEATFTLYEAFAAGLPLAAALESAQRAEPASDLVQTVTDAVAVGPIAALNKNYALVSSTGSGANLGISIEPASE